jgi:hypothetical protein
MIKNNKKIIFAFLYMFTCYQPTQPMLVQQVSLGNFAPAFRWGGNMNELTKDFIVGMIGFIVNLTYDWALKVAISSNDTQASKSELFIECAKLAATTLVGTAGGCGVALTESLYNLCSAKTPPVVLGKLALYMTAILFAQGKLTH